MHADFLSQMLGVLDISLKTAAIFQASGDWSFRLRRPDGDLNVTVVLRGSCWIQVPDRRDPVLLREGDVAVMTHQPWHVISSSPLAFPREANALFAKASPDPRVFGSDPDTVIAATHLRVEEPVDSLLSRLFKPLTVLEARNPQAVTLNWLIHRTWAEASGVIPGGRFAAHQYALLTFTEILRHHLNSQNPVPVSDLRLWTSIELAPAVRLMHDDPARRWRLEELASASAMSRTTFSERFRAIAGTSPLAYLSQWRTVLAGRALRHSDNSISEIASAAGFRSVSAFSNAFKRQVGASPTDFRRRGRAESLEEAPSLGIS